MRFCVLGPLEGYVDGRSVAVGGGRQLALLALLLMHAGEIVSRDRLIEELWDGHPPSSASQSLDVYVSRLRKAFRDAGADEVLITRAPGYMLEAEETDARRFEALAADGRETLAAGDAQRALPLLREALALWRGTAYVEMADEHWARPEAERLEELRLQAVEDRIDAELTLGRHAALVPELELLATRHPNRERLVGQCMLALYRSGRQTDALAAYRAARRSLVEELGLEPGPELRRLEAAVLAQDPALDPPRTRDPGPVATGPADRRRALLGVALGGAALLILTAVALITLVDNDDGHNAVVPANGAGALDPASGRVVTRVEVGSAPAGIATGANRVWVTNGADGTVTRIDPRGGNVDQTLRVGSSPAGVAAGAGALWVANALDGSVSRIDPRAREVVQTIQVGRRPVALSVGEGAVWVADADGEAIVSLDSRSGVPRRRIRLAGSPGGVAVGFGSVWVAEPLARRLVRIDPRSGKVQAEIAVGAGAGPVATGAGAVWVVNRLDGTLSRIDPERDAVASTSPVGSAPTGVAAGAGGVWVTDQGGGELVSVDARTGAVRRRYLVGAAPVGVALLGRTPWVAADAPAGREHRGGTLRVQFGEFSVLDPAQPYEVHPGIGHALGDALVALVDASGAAQLVPDLATAVPQPTDEGLTYGFRLRPGLRYSTGVRVRASDFRREFERLFTTHSELAGMFSTLRGATACAHAPDDCDLSAGVDTDDGAGTVVFHLTRADPEFLFKLAQTAARPVPPGTPRAGIATSPVPGTGPYRVARFDPGRRVVLVRNERFHEWSRAAQPDGYADRIDVRMDNDPNARVRAVLRGDADVALEVASANIAELSTRFASQLRQHAQPNTKFFSFNVLRPPFHDVRARRAVNLAIDRAAVARRFGGLGLSTPTCQVLPPSFPAHEDYCPWTRGPSNGHWHGPDLRRARALVRASGTAGATVDFLTHSGDATGPSAAPVLASTLRGIGYRPRVTILGSGPEVGQRISDTEGGWNISAGDWVADYPSPGQFLERFLMCSNYRPADPARTTNAGGFCQPEFDRLVARAEAIQITDPLKAERIWARADRVAVDQAAWVPLVSTGSVELLSRRAGHFKLDATGGTEIDQLWVR
jgi:ABC-type transport system substrate-binding protein/DNA-binding SARP family transcriptional activator/DNA-binding beta-propeller fold protein YncE